MKQQLNANIKSLKRLQLPHRQQPAECSLAARRLSQPSSSSTREADSRWPLRRRVLVPSRVLLRFPTTLCCQIALCLLAYSVCCNCSASHLASSSSTLEDERHHQNSSKFPDLGTVSDDVSYPSLPPLGAVVVPGEVEGDNGPLRSGPGGEDVPPLALALNSLCPKWEGPASRCSCYQFEDGLFLECPSTGLAAIRSSLLAASASPIKSYTVYHLDPNVTSLPGALFANSSIEKLHISYSAVNNLSSESFSGLEASLKTLAIGNSRLPSVPQAALARLKALEALDLESNEIAEIESYAFYGLPLTSLNLQENRIGSGQLLEYSFGGLENTLEELFLINNRLGSFPLTALRRLRKLHTLKLVGNQISEIPDDGYTRLTALANLDLSRNGIRHLDDRSFITMPKLASLSLATNKLTSIDDKVFVYSTELSSLDLSRNSLRVLNGAVFAELSKLRSLDLSRNHLQQLEVGLFHNLPNLKELFLTRNNLFKLSNGTFYNTSTISALFLEHNAISQMESGVLYNLPHLYQLHLSFNQLKGVPSNLFKHSGEIRSLSLDNNLIGDIAPGTFQELVELRDLRLQKNLLKKIRRSVFYSFPNLQELHLQNNLIDEIEEGSLESLANLAYLNLQGNRLVAVSSALSKYPSSLRYLELNHNSISSIRKEALKGQTRIEILWLDHNRLRQLNKSVFAELSAVEKLYLNHNELVAVEPGTFESLKNLIYLNLEDNQLSHLSAGTFRGAVGLEQLLLSHNLITAVEPDSLQNLPSLRLLHLSHNQIYILRKYMFEGLPLLEELRVAEASVEEIEDQALAALPALRCLDLSGNKLTALAIDFAAMAGVKLLHLASNDFAGVLPAGIFHGLSLEHLDLAFTRFNLSANPRVLEPVLATLQVLKMDGNQMTSPLTFGGSGDRIAHHGSDPVDGYHRDGEEGGGGGEGEESEPMSRHEAARELSLDNNELADVPSPGVLASFPLLETLSLQGNNIKRVSRGAFSGNPRLRTVNMSNNSLSVLDSGAFVGLDRSLRHLNLSNNVIRSIGADVLLGLESLEKLILDNNWFQYIPNNLIQSGLSKLKVLSLSKNPIARVREDSTIAGGFAGLESLSLTEGNLSVIASHDFFGFPALLTLLLRNNHISKISPGSFRSILRLTSLDLSSNEIELLPEERLSGLNQLLALNLSRNHLLEMPSFSPDLIRLRELDLSHNRLTRVDTFEYLGETLRFMSLSNNIIGWIAANAFQNLTLLEVLDMRNNFVTHLQDSLFTPVEVSLESIFLAGNPLHCDCRLLSLWEWLQDHSRYLSAEERDAELLCIQPDKLKDQTVLSLHPVDFCPVPLISFLETTRIDSTEIAFRWDVHNGSLVGGFGLDYHETSALVPAVVNQRLAAEDRGTQINSLVPETHYTICVQANGRYVKMASSRPTPYVVGQLQRSYGEYVTSNRKCIQARTLAFNEKTKISLSILGIIIGSGVCVVFIITLIILLTAIKWQRRRRRRHVKANDVPEEYITYRHFSLPSNENVYS